MYDNNFTMFRAIATAGVIFGRRVFSRHRRRGMAPHRRMDAATLPH